MIKDLFILTHPERPIQSRIRSPRWDTYTTLEAYLRTVPNFQCPRCISILPLQELMIRYFRLLRFFATIRVRYPTDQDLINITIINTTTDTLHAFSQRVKTMIGRYFIKQVKLHPNDTISITLNDPRYHQHPIEEITTYGEQQQMIEQRLLHTTTQTNEAIRKLRCQRRLPNYYLTNTQKLMTFTHYTRLIYEFDQMKSLYRHRRYHSIIKPSYIRKHYTKNTDDDFIDFRIYG